MKIESVSNSLDTSNFLKHLADSLQSQIPDLDLKRESIPSEGKGEVLTALVVGTVSGVFANIISSTLKQLAKSFFQNDVKIEIAINGNPVDIQVTTAKEISTIIIKQ
ncbi:hypothetical protein [Solidesulfovibrio carbinolicus]|uniref:hypothetical protein n=1 Tax=Solidesulfovibrio carbinolicus TaxID=296842 RepID=UPI0010137233|nr:hypothetical protein [Solidesulfovibrio carbinolicus]